MPSSSLSRRTFLASTGLVALAGPSLVQARVALAAAAKVGAAAPTFSAQSSAGTSVSLADFGGKIVVLEWTNHDCPYVRKHYETSNMQALQKEITGQGVVWLTLISSAPNTQGYVTAAEANELTKTRGAAPTAVLFDPTGTIGKSYGATNTPHMYVIDKAGVLQYAGAIDDKPTTRKSDVPGAQNYVRAAVQSVAAGERVMPPVTRG
jgi:peroxiredoxin